MRLADTVAAPWARAALRWVPADANEYEVLLKQVGFELPPALRAELTTRGAFDLAALPEPEDNDGEHRGGRFGLAVGDRCAPPRRVDAFALDGQLGRPRLNGEYPIVPFHEDDVGEAFDLFLDGRIAPFALDALQSAAWVTVALREPTRRAGQAHCCGSWGRPRRRTVMKRPRWCFALKRPPAEAFKK